MGRLPPLWFGYRYPCTDQYSTSSDESMTDYDTGHSSDEERDDPGHLHPREFFQNKFVSLSALSKRRDRFKTPPPCNPVSYPANITPIKSSMSGVKTAKGVKDDRVKSFLQKELPGKIATDYPVIDFVRTVWNFTPDDIPQRQEGYSIKGTHWTNYMASRRSARGGSIQEERGCYVWLKAIFDDLIQQLSFGEPAVAAEFINLRDRQVKGHFANFKPDFVYGPPELPGDFRANWEWLGIVGEVKKTKHVELRRGDFPIDLTQFKKNTFSPNLRKRRKGCCRQDERPPKRRRTSKSGKTETDPNGEEKLTEDELQATKYVNELLSHGIRSYATGFIIRDSLMRLWYADRMGLVESAPFEMFYYPHLLLLVVAAIRKANLPSLGVCPFLHFPSSTFNSYDGAKLILPNATDLDEEETGELEFDVIVNDDRSVFTAYGAVGRGTTVVPVEAAGKTREVLGEEKLVAKVAWPSKGRKAEDSIIKLIRRKLRATKPDYLKHIVDLKYSVTRTMRDMQIPRASMKDLRQFGLADVEARVCRTLILKAYHPLELVNSPDEFRTIFIDVVRGHHYVWQVAEVLHRDISINNIMFFREHNHAIGVLCDWDLAMITSEPEWGSEEQDPDVYGIPDEDDCKSEDNVDIFHADAEDSDNQQDTEVENSRNQQNAEVEDSDDQHDDAVDGEEKDATEKYQQSEEGFHDVDKVSDQEGREAGVVEIAGAGAPENESDVQQHRARYRTGTGPFMALDLLKSGDTPLHLYRHDLESFFYVLVWFCVGFNPTQHRIGYISSWQKQELTQIGHAKADFLEDRKIYDGVVASAHRGYELLLETWAFDLRALFRRLSTDGGSVKNLREELREAMEKGNEERGAAVRARLERATAEREALVSYEEFMRILGIDSSDDM
ncbi:hypothetical protein AcW1_005472 [Taiwanofungus camphoratus]|nr:hypothetical protein AcW2_004238 [Antrodia cinnamomea]KAI0956907.1 hypothetical protein AcW1_005472 [Antrodia cinnamomea]